MEVCTPVTCTMWRSCIDFLRHSVTAIGNRLIDMIMTLTASYDLRLMNLYFSYCPYFTNKKLRPGKTVIYQHYQITKKKWLQYFAASPTNMWAVYWTVGDHLEHRWAKHPSTEPWAQESPSQCASRHMTTIGSVQVQKPIHKTAIPMDSCWF